MAVNWLQVLFNSAITGSLYLLGAVGLTLTYSLSGFPNFAHAEFITLGAFIGFWATSQIGLPFPVSLLAALLVTGVIGLLCYRGVFHPLTKRGATVIHLMVGSIALGFVLRYSIGMIWSWKPDYFASIGPTWRFGSLTVLSLWLWLIITAVVLTFFMHLVLVKTKIGKAIRATASNRELALASGINTDRVILITWFIGAGLAAVAGVFRAADTQVWPLTGWDIILPIFAVTILGGIGNFYGAIVASFVLGLAENVGVVGLTAMGLSTEYRAAVAFVILIVTLLVKPQGLAALFRRA